MTRHATIAPVGDCRSCENKILWLMTTKGKLIPLNACPVRDGNMVIENHGSGLLAVAFQPLIHGSHQRYVSHFATCPDADDWRKSK